MVKVGIVGGGISGLAAAVALGRAGHEVELFERAPELAEVGSGLTLWANATRVLRGLGVLERCLAVSRPIREFQLRLRGGKRLMTIPIERFETPAVVMHRAALQAALKDAVPGGIWTDHACLGARDEGRGVFLRFACGERGPYDLVLGADGLRSALRAEVVAADAPAYRGYYVWRGVAAIDAPGYAVGQISETWGRGERFGILPMSGGRVCWYAAQNRALAAATPAAGRHELLRAWLAGWHDPIGQLLAATPAGAILENPAFDRAPRRGWSKGRVLLIGDAAHPLTPNLGQGACMALEDAMVLASVLGSAGPAQVPEAVRAFEALRFGRIAAMVRRCRWLGALGHWQLPPLAAARNAVASVLPGVLFAHTSRKIQAYAAERAGER